MQGNVYAAASISHLHMNNTHFRTMPLTGRRLLLRDISVLIPFRVDRIGFVKSLKLRFKPIPSSNLKIQFVISKHLPIIIYYARNAATSPGQLLIN